MVAEMKCRWSSRGLAGVHLSSDQPTSRAKKKVPPCRTQSHLLEESNFLWCCGCCIMKAININFTHKHKQEDVVVIRLFAL